MNEEILLFVNQKIKAGKTLAQAVVDAGLQFELSSTLIYLSIIQAERRRM